ncbi:putative bifunctional diguanylate cyclase/phosphodiesterase [Inhella gelatinilytica]|uniref:EAL domain-containing protein n=1 Tax=Inhella gelatinilytica TaxID=2795030 RepID=A0A931IVH9_9BURK|nr:EAL domain-containing protein [Inhella gelatinilytica]MBH9553552.1 EAL domain-containing protein [Inhella gelatinilytica]
MTEAAATELGLLWIVDDDEVGLMATAAALRARGFEVVEMTSGEEALVTLEATTPDLIVLDALMPGMDGFETCRRLRQVPHGESVPVLMLTGLDDDASIEHAYEVGATDFFIKSRQWSLLAGRLRYLLRSARTRQELERSQTRLARAQALARMGSFEWRVGHTIHFSDEARQVLALRDSEWGLSRLLRMVPRAERGLLTLLLRDVREQHCAFVTDMTIRAKLSRTRMLHVEAEPIVADTGQFLGYSGVVQDVTDRRNAEDKIRQLAHFDALTGLPNRRQLMWRAERALDAARRKEHIAAMLLVDLDRFKNINDTLGHAAGDELLIEIARRLRACVRHSDQVSEGALEAGSGRNHRALEAVGRLGGDEFVCLLPEVQSEADAERVAARVLDALAEPVFVAGQDCFVTASVGIALFPRDGSTVADLLRSADMAMYAVKEQGRNGSAQFSPQLGGLGRERLELESALHRALERQELVLYYQPKVDAVQGQLVGFEALMRWKRGDRLVPPGDFIPVAEETGLILPMSEWALAEASRQARLWQDRLGLNQAIAVNLPNRLFERPDLVEKIHDAVSQAGVAHCSLKLEITETGLMKDLHAVIPTLHRLTAIGVEISIDDFGTGYSSLSYLTSLPLSELKIDRSFVRDLGVSPQGAAVVTAIIALARSLGLSVVAEGVETPRQLDVLRRLGCRVMQGYLFAKPMPGDEVERWVETQLRPRKAEWLRDCVQDGEAPPPVPPGFVLPPGPLQ